MACAGKREVNGAPSELPYIYKIYKVYKVYKIYKIYKIYKYISWAAARLSLLVTFGRYIVGIKGIRWYKTEVAYFYLISMAVCLGFFKVQSPKQDHNIIFYNHNGVRKGTLRQS